MPLVNPSLPSAGAAAFIEFYGHSYFRLPVGTGTAANAITIDNSGQMNWVLASALNVTPGNFRNHAVVGAQLSNGSRSSGGFARPLAEINPSRKLGPFIRSGGTYFGCWGINDLGHWGTATTTSDTYMNGLRTFISRARASAVYPAGGGAPWALGANFAAPAAATFQDITGGNATRATVVNSGGTSVATFTIPYGYLGEPIAFAMLTSGAATGGDITLGGTVTGTSGIVGTVITTDSKGVNSTYGIRCIRFTAAANGLTSKNSGQTITLTVTRVSASGELIIDSAWIEASKADPVVVCNQPKLPSRTYTYAVGDLTTVVGTTITSNTANFLTALDATASITETDAQGAFTAGKTISSVTNATTAVLSATAAAAKTNVEVTIGRILNGYKFYSGGSDNANFIAATVASHAAADTDVGTLNGWMTTVVAEFDSMVQIADLDTALGSDAKVPAGLYSYFNTDGLHPNEYGSGVAASVMFQALQRCTAAVTADMVPLEAIAIASPIPGNDRWPRRQIGSVYLAPCSALSTLATFTAIGTLFAIPIVITESGEKWGGAQIEVTTAYSTQTTLRWGVYDDPNWVGYPQNLWKEPTSGGTVATGTTTGVKSLTALNWTMEPGLFWIILKSETAGVAGSVRSILGPTPLMPQWLTAGGASAPIGWTITGLAAAVLPNQFPAGATMSTNVPAVGIISAAV